MSREEQRAQEALAAIGWLKQTLGIRTTFVYPPIPDRNHDWCAVGDNYDGAEDAGPQATGEGRTEAMAVAEYIASAMSLGGLI